MFDPITAGINLGSKIADVIGKWVPDTAARDQATAEIVGQVNGLIAGQIELNKVDSQSSSKFVTHWRPAIGWICGISLGYAVIGYSFLSWGAMLAGLPALPPPDTTITLEILFGMLGLGGMRTFEKYKGVSK